MVSNLLICANYRINVQISIILNVRSFIDNGWRIIVLKILMVIVKKMRNVPKNILDGMNFILKYLRIIRYLTNQLIIYAKTIILILVVVKSNILNNLKRCVSVILMGNAKQFVSAKRNILFGRRCQRILMF